MIVFSVLVIDFCRRLRSEKPFAKWVRMGIGKSVETNRLNAVETAQVGGGSSATSTARTREAGASSPASKVEEAGSVVIMSEKERKGWRFLLTGVGISSLMIILRG